MLEPPKAPLTVLARWKPPLRISTVDPAEFAEALSPVAPGVSAMAGRHRRFHVDLQEVALPHLGLFEVHLEDARVLRTPNAYLAVTVPLAGELQFVRGRSVTTHSAGQAHILWPDEQLDLRVSQESSLLVCTFPGMSILKEPRSARRPPSHLRGIDRSTEEGRAFLRFLGFMWRELRMDVGLFRSPLVSQEIESTCQRLFQLAVASQSGTDRPRDGDVGPKPRLQRAREFIESRLREGVSLDEMVVACRTSPSSLLRSFKGELGTTPMRYLKQRRLEAVRVELLGGSTGSASVTDTALRYGFQHLGRFSADYRRAFGELPSETLRGAGDTVAISGQPTKFG